MQRIAIVGSGIAGMGAAWLLDGQADVTVFEAEARPGGHTHTVMVGEQPVDTGFIVLNNRNYPRFSAFLDELGIHTQPSDMSFGVTIGDGRIEWAGDSWRTLFAQKSRLFDRQHWRMLADIVRFNRQGKQLIASDAPPAMTLGAFLDTHRYSEAFAARYLLPMAAAIWSTPTADMRDFPVVSFLRFFDHHGLLDVADRPQWRTVVGGSHQYVRALTRRLGGRLRLSAPVVRVRRRNDSVHVETAGASAQCFDQVVFACHPGRALATITDADTQEHELLSEFEVQPNRAVLHTDIALMPKRRRLWSSWNYAADRAEVTDQRVSVTYWMNRLQAIAGDTNYFVSLNPLREPAPAHVVREIEYRHPVFDTAAIEAQPRLDTIQGRRGLWFCGAWCGYGFHEDGLAAATRVAEGLGVRAPWSG